VIPFVIAVGIFIEMLGTPVEERSHIVRLFSWITGRQAFDRCAYQVDQLSILMTLIVTGVGSLIHVYSIGYNAWRPRFLEILCLSESFYLRHAHSRPCEQLCADVSWLGGRGPLFVSVDRLLVRKNFEKGTTGDAAKKAFIVNRVGDFGFFLQCFS